MAEIDINENLILYKYPGILEILLIDRTTGVNLIWGTNNYVKFGKGYNETDFLEVNKISNDNINIIKPRNNKSKFEQKERIKEMAEVFTPSWICNSQINMIDDKWFGYTGAFNIETNKGWCKSEKVIFNEHNWQEYVDLERIEITCGEGPYLASRYDVVSGEYIEPMNRIGIIDRKLRVISENISNEKHWFESAKTAFMRTYGYDYQGDNVLLARESLLLTFIDFYSNKYNKEPNFNQIIEIASIISWNIWQMDGLKFVVPMSCVNKFDLQLKLFDDEKNEVIKCKGCLNGNINQHIGEYSKIRDWRAGKVSTYIDLIR